MRKLLPVFLPPLMLAASCNRGIGATFDNPEFQTSLVLHESGTFEMTMNGSPYLTGTYAASVSTITFTMLPAKGFTTGAPTKTTKVVCTYEATGITVPRRHSHGQFPFFPGTYTKR